MVETANTLWRDYATDGVPGSGAHNPVKADLREWGTWIESGKAFGIWRDTSTGYLRLGWDGTVGFEYAGYRLDSNFTQTDIGPSSADHLFHLYGDVAADALSSLGQMTGFYAHLDGDPTTILSGITVSDLSPHRGNLTWGVDGTLTSGRGGQFSARVFDTSGTPGLDGDGTIATGYGVYALACTDTAGTGVMTNAYGAWLEAANYDSTAGMTSAVAAYLMTRNLAAGGGITTGYGLRIDYASAGTGITTYYSIYNTVANASGVWGLYFSGTVKHYIAGWVGIGTQTEVAKLYIYDTDTSHNALRINHAATSGFTSDVFRIISGMASGTGFDLISAEASGGSDPKFRVRGDGTVTADVSFTGGGADYAIWREWSDGNAANENRVGKTVVWDGRKIRLAQKGDRQDMIRGVVTRNATIVENGDNGKWKGKFLSDPFGAVIKEIFKTVEVEYLSGEESDDPVDYVKDGKEWRKLKAGEKMPRANKTPAIIEGKKVLVVEEPTVRTEPGEVRQTWDRTFIDAALIPADGGEFVIGEQTYRTIKKPKTGSDVRDKLNPDYDPDRDYDPRETRIEWEQVGVMGELRVLHGEPVNQAWDFLESVTETYQDGSGNNVTVTVDYYWSGPGQMAKAA